MIPALPIALALLLQAPTPAPGAPDELAALDVHLDRLEAAKCSGLVFVARGEEVLYERGFGLADRENRRAWTRSTLAPVGSITKQFTAAAVMKLVEAGKLSVDDTLADHFEDVPKDKAGITLRQLLTHTSGLAGPGIPDPEWIDRDDLVLTVLEAPLRFEPGSRYSYSNMGFSFLAAIIEKETGERYVDFVRDELLLPAGMEESGYPIEGFDRARLSVGYAGERRTGTLPEDVYTEYGPSWVLLGNGGILSTADDMHRWALALLDSKVLSKASIEQLWTPAVDESNGAKESFYGFGWSIVDTPDGRVVTHNGGDRVNFADFAIVPVERLVVYVATNAVQGCPALQDLAAEIVRHVLAGAPFPER